MSYSFVKKKYRSYLKNIMLYNIIIKSEEDNMEELRQEKLIKTIKPKFSFIYELGMPTGKKIKSSLFSLVLFIFLLIMIFFNTDFLYQYSYNVTENMNVVDALKILCIILVVFTGVKPAIHIILQKKQYENISCFYYGNG